MSTTNQSTTVECNYPSCETLGNYWEFRHGDYCSTDCELRHHGFQVLQQFRLDHRRCFTCFRRLKTTNPPKPDFEFTEKGHGWTLDENGDPQLEFYDQSVSREAACGFQFDTEHATKGEKQHDQRGDAVVTGTICDSCGNTDHTAHDEDLADHDAIQRLADLLSHEADAEIDPETLHRIYNQTHDLDRAAGEALTDDHHDA